MKLLGLFLAMTTASAFAQDSFVNFIRQTQQGTGVVWDMPVAANGTAASALPMESSGALFQLWTINQAKGSDHLLDQKLVGAYLPTADIKVTTLDPDGKTPRTRVDQPFTVEIQVAGLLTVGNFPQSASQVLMAQHVANHSVDSTALDPELVLTGTPFSTGYLSDNGKTVLRFPSASLTASDATKASGEEHFVVHALSDGNLSQSQIASAQVQVWPVACGEIKGIQSGDVIGFQSPGIELILNNLYPRSDSFLMLYEGSSIQGVTGTLVKAYPTDRDTTSSTVIRVDELDGKFKADGTHTLALMSRTVYGTELLCPPVTFQVKRPLQVNAMQVGFSNGKAP